MRGGLPRRGAVAAQAGVQPPGKPRPRAAVLIAADAGRWSATPDEGLGVEAAVGKVIWFMANRT